MQAADSNLMAQLKYQPKLAQATAQKILLATAHMLLNLSHIFHTPRKRQHFLALQDRSGSSERTRSVETRSYCPSASYPR
jgi:hypothetical protein